MTLGEWRKEHSGGSRLWCCAPLPERWHRAAHFWILIAPLQSCGLGTWFAKVTSTFSILVTDACRGQRKGRERKGKNMGERDSRKWTQEHKRKDTGREEKACHHVCWDYALALCVPNGSLLNDETSAEWRALGRASQNRNLSIYSED